MKAVNDSAADGVGLVVSSDGNDDGDGAAVAACFLMDAAAAVTEGYCHYY